MSRPERDPTDAERELYVEVMEAVLDTLDSFADNPLINKPTGLEPSVLIDGAFRAIAEIIAASHRGHPPSNCTCEENAVHSLRYALQLAHAEWAKSNPSHAQH